MNYSSGNNSDQSSNNNHYPPLPPTPGQFYPPPPPNNGQSRPYNNAILVGLVVTSVLSIVLISVGGNNAGTSLFLGVIASIAIADWKGFTSLKGWIHWKQMSNNKRTGMGCLFFFVLPIMSCIYLVRACLAAFQSQPAGQMSARANKRRANIAIAIGTIVTLISFVFATAASTTGTDSAAIPVTPTAVVHTKISLPSTAVNRPAPTPTPIPTQKPQKVVISVPTRIPSPTPHAPQPTATPMKSLFVTFTSAYATDYVSGSVSVHTLPGAALTITVSYCSGYNATSKSLQGTSYADGNGDYTWTWEPETKCRGAATASVIASLNGQSVSNADSFTVQ
ncbi:MAG TPA: hypothetical protein VEL31_28115 [Ktedonobacteraceae bacterium]|nr:hypothetical protein [Ktedonobacteraceae bacterium]